MRTRTARARRSTNAVVIYLIILVSFQVFLVTVAVEGFLIGDESVAWSAAVVSVALAVGSAFFARALRP
ncbi:MAG: hypothetical protein MUF83_07945 [Acidimicrobiales bacterium]|jgi:hypothetical protein|nr:hypothetical protein [Acidimicrobiales bacterium]